MNQNALTDADLLAVVSRIKSTMISVATGGPRIQDVNAEFAEDAGILNAELVRRGVSNPLGSDDLWVWHGFWSSGQMPTYASRRVYVNGLFETLVKRINSPTLGVYEPTGWDRVDRNADELRRRFSEAVTEEQFQAVGLLCREALISTAQAVFDPDLHPTSDGVKASDTDAKRMLEAYIPVVLTGSANDFLRKHARASLDLAVHLQHRRTATFREAALCVEATTSVINTIAIVAGLRDPKK
jgi:hypothetical protein